jgi:putative inorganic carbon (hco3(-)) transporter
MIHAASHAETLELALQSRAATLARAGERWSRLAFLGALAFVAMLYANPMYWFPVVERARLGLVTAGICAGAVIMRRLTSGERIRLGGPAALPLFGYGAVAFLSFLWSLDPPASARFLGELAKLFVLYVAVQNALDAPSRLRAFFVVAGLAAAVGPGWGTIERWRDGVELLEGVRSRWVGMYADPNRVAMSLIAVMPLTLSSAFATRRRWLKVALFAATGIQLGGIVLTHSRSGSIAAGLALALYLFRGRAASPAKKLLVGAAIAAGLLALAPSSFWQRNETIEHFDEDASLEGRRNSWKVLAEIVADRPLGGVGAGAYLAAWDTYAPLSAGGRRLVAHNVFMEILGELGAVALLFYFAFVAGLLWRLWFAGRDGLVGDHGRALFAALAGYLVVEMVNGYSLSWFMYFLFGCGAACVRLARLRAGLAAQGRA